MQQRILKLSLVMPALNEAASIDATFASIFAQTRLPDEIVVADGGSLDGTPDIVRRYDGRAGVRVICTHNPARFAGGGRNAAARAASGDLLVGMDFGNRADPRYLERMEAAFIADPDADYAGGPHFPLIETPFERAYAAVLDYPACIVEAIPPAEWTRLGDLSLFVPGGMNLAFSRRFFERSAGFCAWVGACEDPLMGMRARYLGARIVLVPDAIVWYHMGRSNRETWRRICNYSRWSSRLSIQRGLYRNVLFVAVGTAALFAAASWMPVLAFAALALPGAYLGLFTARRLRRIASITRRAFTVRECMLVLWLKAFSDLATLYGLALGIVDRVRDPAWPRRVQEWVQAPPVVRDSSGV